MSTASPAATLEVLAEVLAERERQEVKWGQQDHIDGTGPYLRIVLDEAGYLRWHGIRADELETWARARCQNPPGGLVTYEQILTEEWAEVVASDDPDELRRELIQVAAVAVAWCEKLDREARTRTT